MKALTYLEVDLDKCSRVYGVSPCTASLVMAGADAPQAVNFDGSAAYLTRGAGFTSAADSKLLTFAAVVRLESLTDAQILSSATAAAGATLRFRVEISSSRIRFIGINSAGTTILSVTNSANLEIGRWYTILGSFDLASVSNRYLYVNDASSLTVTTYTNDTIDFTLGDWSVGAAPDGSAKFTGDIAQLWFNHGTFLDLSNMTNRRLFFSASNQPVSLGSTGQTPTGSSPRLFLNGEVAAWHTNLGGGGGMTLHGSLSETPSEIGRTKCFNTLATCQDLDHYDEVGQTLRFAVDTGYLPQDIEATPSILAVEVTPGSISLGEDLGERMGLMVTFKDHPHSDTLPGLVDPYLADRDYVPYERGTFWGKFKARHPYFRGREMRLYYGELGQSVAEMEERVFLGDSISGPTSNGQFSMSGKDPLKLADGDRAMAPVLSSGFLADAVTETDTIAYLSPTGVGDEEYPVSGTVNIGNGEVCSYIRDLTAGNDANTLLMLHFDGADGSTTITDSSSSAKTASPVGSTQIDTAQSVFGGTSCIFDGASDRITVPDNNDWTFSGNFTVDMRVRITSLASARGIFGHGTNGTNQYRLIVATNGTVTFEVLSGGSAIISMASSAGAILVNTWYHLAVVRNGNVFTLYKNGVSIATTTDADAIPNFTGNFNVGCDGNNSNDYIGWIDEFRVSNVARWTTGFTTPVAPYMSSTDGMYLTRAQHNTVAQAHDDQDRVQLCLEYDAVDPATIIEDLLVTYAGVPSGYIPIDDWLTEVSSYLNRVYTTLIANPTPVKKLIGELVQQAGLAIWWDDRNSHVGLQVLRRVPTSAAVISESEFVMGSLDVRDQPDKRVSEVWTYYGQIDPVKTLDERGNYRSVEATVDLQSESLYGSAVIKEIFSRWIPQFGRTIATRINEIHLSRFKNPPRIVTFMLMRGGSVDEPLRAAGYQLASRFFQDSTGLEVLVPVQITRLRPSESQYDVVAEEIIFSAEDEDLSNRIITVDGNTKNFNLREVHDSLYPAIESGQSVTCIVQSGVIVGSDSTALSSLDIGDWPAGVTINLEVYGRIQGAGGTGGAGKQTGVANDGEDGGGALLTAVPMNLSVADGEIWGGGGGGGGGRPPGGTNGNAGGGGAGTVFGSGGAGVGSRAGDDGTSESGGDPGTGGGAQAGGAGGDPGVDGDNGTPFSGGAGGSAGYAIFGNSMVTVITGPGSILGPQIG